MKNLKWHFRKNTKRKISHKKGGSHPSLVIGESEDGTSYYNIGLTHAKRRGHHNNIEIHDPKDWSKTSFVRDDIQVDSKEYLKVVLNSYKLNPKDIDKIWKIIKKRIPTRR